MRSKTITIITVIIIIIIIILFLEAKLMIPQGWQPNLARPGFLGIGKHFDVSPSSTPKPTPRQFKFDATTNLEQELESVDPAVKSEDFEELKKVIDSI